MRKVILSVVLAVATIAYAGCSTSGDGGGGGAGGDELQAISFNGDTSVPATGASAIAIDYSVGLASVISSMLGALAIDASSESASVSPKLLVDEELQICTNEPGGTGGTGGAGGTGTAVLNGNLEDGEEVTLTLTNCKGSPLSSAAINGRIVLDIATAEPGGAGGAGGSGPLAMLTSSVTANATLEEFTIGTDTALEGGFAVDAILSISVFSFSPLDIEVTEFELVLGSSSVSIANLIAVEENGTLMLFACINISTKIATSPLAIEYFYPQGVLALDSQGFTLNSVPEPESIGFDLSSGRAVPNSGMLRLFSGDLFNCFPPEAGVPPGDGSFATASFRLETDDALVDIRAETSSGTVYECTEEWENLLDTLRDVTAFDSCPCVNCGTGGTGGSGGSGGTGGTGGGGECTFENLDQLKCDDRDIYICTSTEGWQLFQDCQADSPSSECEEIPGGVSCST